jgi:peptide/nickel transport system ATP-binding protein
MTATPPPTLELEDLSIVYDTEEGPLEAVRRVSLTIAPRECFGLVGESGSGKTTLAMGAIRYLAANGRLQGGEVRLRGRSLTAISLEDMCNVWGKQIGMVYQNPGGALNPSLTIGRQIAESAMIHQAIPRKAALQLTLRMLSQVAMPNPETVVGLYPHQLSGGMLQRCIIAMALINSPALLILDEPTTALDVTTQAVVLDLVADLKREADASILYITHDLAVVAKICDRIGVMYAGQLVEVGPKRPVFLHARHPYTMSLLGCIPHFEPESRKHSLVSIPGRIPRLNRLPEGCIFAPRCFFVQERCRRERPALEAVGPGQRAACFFARELPAKVEDVTGRKHFPRPAQARPLLTTAGLAKHYETQGTFFRRARGRRVQAVNDVSLELPAGFTLGIVGESGCGKTTLMRTIIGLLAPTAGEVRLEGVPLPSTTARRPRESLRKIQMVFQNPDASLNPRHTVAEAIQRPMRLLKGLPAEELVRRSRALLSSVNLPAHYLERYPHELSGGEKQRVAIARAFAADPALVLLDEPLSALDVSVQASLINLLFELQAEKKAAYLFISHDLAAVHHLSDAVAVMYLGRVVETGEADEVFAPPYHPYTEALLSAIPVADPTIAQENIRLSGSVPSAAAIPPGCPFHTRCPRMLGALCQTTLPPWRGGQTHSRIHCHIPLDELARLQADTITHRAANGEGA